MQEQLTEFENSVYTAFSGYKNDFNYNNIVDNHLNIERFYPWVEQVNQYKKVLGSTIFSSGCGSARDLMAFCQI